MAGTHAAQMAVGLGAEVTVIDRSLMRLRELDALFAGRLRTLASTAASIEEAVMRADLVIGSARAGRFACALCFRWNVNSGWATRLAYQSRLPGVPVMKSRPFTVWNQISMRRGWPLLHPVVVMSMVRSWTSACSICLFMVELLSGMFRPGRSDWLYQPLYFSGITCHAHLSGIVWLREQVIKQGFPFCLGCAVSV